MVAYKRNNLDPPGFSVNPLSSVAKKRCCLATARTALEPALKNKNNFKEEEKFCAKRNTFATFFRAINPLLSSMSSSSFPPLSSSSPSPSSAACAVSALSVDLRTAIGSALDSDDSGALIESCADDVFSMLLDDIVFGMAADIHRYVGLITQMQFEVRDSLKYFEVSYFALYASGPSKLASTA